MKLRLGRGVLNSSHIVSVTPHRKKGAEMRDKRTGGVLMVLLVVVGGRRPVTETGGQVECTNS